jgi:transcriptional regulator with XRE-family HTH domain
MADKIKLLTAAEKAEARKLKALFEAKKRELGLTQEKLGELLGTTQGGVSHYLNGRARISDYTLLRFAHHLKIDPEQVRPGLLARLPHVSGAMELSDRALLFAREFDELPEGDQELLVSLLARVHDAEHK